MSLSDTILANRVNSDLIAIVDGNANHRRQIRDALASSYRVVEYGDSTNALMGLNLIRPGLILVGEHVPPSRGINFIRAVLNDRALGRPPVIFLAGKSDPESLKAALDSGATDCLMTPYRRSDLRRAINTQLDAQNSRRWLSLPQPQREALESARSVFNGIADVIDGGGTIQYLAVEESCSTLVDCVNGVTLPALLEAAAEHHDLIFAHSFHMAATLAAFGQSIGLAKNQRLLMAAGGLLHDIGKLSIPHAVLFKREPLTKEEDELIRSHVLTSLRILKGSEDLPSGVAVIVGRHHEKLDGSGYPNGVGADQLNDLARLSAIADTFLCLAYPIGGQARKSPRQALKTMTEEMDGQLDKKLLAKFAAMLLLQAELA